jgi:hypothetical protein
MGRSFQLLTAHALPAASIRAPMKLSMMPLAMVLSAFWVSLTCLSDLFHKLASLETIGQISPVFS